MSNFDNENFIDSELNINESIVSQLNNGEELGSDLGAVEQTASELGSESHIDSLLDEPLVHKYSGESSDNIDVEVDNENHVIRASLKRIKFPSLSQFPEIGSEKLIYIANDEKILYGWDSNDGYFKLSAGESTGGAEYDDTQIKKDIKNLQENKVDKVSGKGLSTNDFTTEDKDKLDRLENYDDSSIKQSINQTLNSSKSYTDTKIAGLIDSAPETLDTFKEIADAFAENDEVLDTLNRAIGNKADKAEIPDMSNYYTKTETDNEFATRTDLSTKANNSTVTTLTYKVANLETDNTTNKENISNIQSKLDGIEDGAQKNAVESVNGKTGNVQLNASDVGALPSDTKIPTTVKELSDGSDYITETKLNERGYALQSNVYLKSEVNKMAFTIINTQYIRITDLDSGVYKLTYNGHKFLYYYGRTSNISQELYSNGTLILFVTKNITQGYDAFYWTWEVFAPVADNRYPAIHYGITEIDSGTARSSRLDVLDYANVNKPGVVAPDGETITINSWGTISAKGGGSKVIVEVWK